MSNEELLIRAEAWANARDIECAKCGLINSWELGPLGKIDEVEVSRHTGVRRFPGPKRRLVPVVCRRCGSLLTAFEEQRAA